MKKVIIVWFLFLSFTASAQLYQPNDFNKFKMGIILGLNYSKFSVPEIEFQYGTMPLIGIFVKKQFAKGLHYRATFNYSNKSSKIGSSTDKIENHYAEFSFMPQYEIFEGIYINGGISMSGLVKSYMVVLDGNSGSGRDRTDYTGFNSEINLLAGVEFDLSENVDIAFNYIIPTLDLNTTSFQMSIGIDLLYEKPSVSYTVVKDVKSESQILALKKGVLLIHLNDSKRVLDKMEEYGENKKAVQLREYNRLHNMAISSSFRNDFNFCEVRFFYSSDSKNIYEAKFENVFLNDSLEIDSSICVKLNTPVFIAEFCNIDQDTVKNFSHLSYEPNSNFSLKKTKNYYNESDFGFYALIIKDHSFVQLNSPFPYYVRNSRVPYNKSIRQLLFLPHAYPSKLGKSVTKSVQILNSNLFDFYFRTYSLLK